MAENNFLLRVKDREAATSRILGMDDYYYLVKMGCRLGASKEMFSYIQTSDKERYIRYNPKPTTPVVVTGALL